MEVGTVSTLLKEIHYGFRGLLRQPAFTLVAVITLALGIGANSTIFSVISALILTPPTIAEPEKVVAIWTTPVEKRNEGFVSYLDLQDWRLRNQSFEDIAAYKPHGFILSDNGDAQRIQGMRVTANFLPLLRISPLRGRNFVADEENRNSQKVVLLGYD